VLELELCTGRLSSGAWGERVRRSIKPVERPVLGLRDAHAVLREFASWREDACLTLGGVGDPLSHPRWRELTLMAEELGFACVHVRTELTGADIDPGAFEDSGVHVLSVDTMARSGERARQLTHHDRHGVMLERMTELARAQGKRASAGLLPTVWCVPRITRCDEVYDEIPDWYDVWNNAGFAPIIDPLPAKVRAARIAPLTLPGAASARLRAATVRVRSDLTLADAPGVRIDRAGVREAWRALRRARRSSEGIAEVKHAPADSAA
jgi:hypothetical protein